MKVTVYLKGEDVCRVCFRARERGIDIKAVSELMVRRRLWDADRMRYRRTTIVGKEEQRIVRERVRDIVDEMERTFTRSANGEWLRRIVARCLSIGVEGTGVAPMLRRGETRSIVERIDEYIAQHTGTKRTRELIGDLRRRVGRFVEFRRFVEGDRGFELKVETMTAGTFEEVREYIGHEHMLRCKHQWFFKGRVQGRPRRLAGSTIINIVERLCMFVRWCQRMGYCDGTVLCNYKAQKHVFGDPFFLTSGERASLFDIDLGGDREMEAVRDVFVFQCYVGCRVSDLMRLTRDNVRGGFLEYVPQKTRRHRARTVRVPLHDKARRILERHTGENALLPFSRLHIYNIGIRMLLRRCGINRFVTLLDTHGYVAVQRRICDVATSHTARKTFIGNLYSIVPDPNVIASMSGHAEGSRAFSRYRKIDDDMKRRVVAMIE